jgi:hypothetical protein
LNVGQAEFASKPLKRNIFVRGKNDSELDSRQASRKAGAIIIGCLFWIVSEKNIKSKFSKEADIQV